MIFEQIRRSIMYLKAPSILKNQQYFVRDILPYGSSWKGSRKNFRSSLIRGSLKLSPLLSLTFQNSALLFLVYFQHRITCSLHSDFLDFFPLFFRSIFYAHLFIPLFLLSFVLDRAIQGTSHTLRPVIPSTLTQLSSFLGEMEDNIFSYLLEIWNVEYLCCGHNSPRKSQELVVFPGLALMGVAENYKMQP